MTIQLRRRPRWQCILRFPAVFVTECWILWGEGPWWQVLEAAWMLSVLSVKRAPWKPYRAPRIGNCRCVKVPQRKE